MPSTTPFQRPAALPALPRLWRAGLASLALHGLCLLPPQPLPIASTSPAPGLLQVHIKPTPVHTARSSGEPLVLPGLAQDVPPASPHRQRSGGYRSPKRTPDALEPPAPQVPAPSAPALEQSLAVTVPFEELLTYRLALAAKLRLQMLPPLATNQTLVLALTANGAQLTPAAAAQLAPDWLAALRSVLQQTPAPQLAQGQTQIVNLQLIAQPPTMAAGE